MKKKIILIVAILLVAVGGAYITMHTSRASKRGSGTSQVATVTRGTLLETVEATGTVQPLNRVEIKPPIAGRVEKLLVDEGDRVTAGQILAWMSSSDRAAILDAARAQGADEVKKWEDAYKATPVIAPLSGSIILRNVVVGQTVDTATPLFAMSDKLIIQGDVDETDIGRVKIGMPAEITLDAYPDQSIQGAVFQILYEGKNVSNVITYGVKIEPKKVPPFFRSQMTANIRLIARKKEDVLVLPASAIRTTSSGEHEVMVPGPDQKPAARPVEVGLETGDQAEIVSGLSEGDKVLIVRKRYTPQQAASQSPLVMGARKSGQGSGGQGQGQQRPQGGRGSN